MEPSFLSVFGHTAVDIILKVDEMPELNTSTPIKERIIRRGGTAANISIGAARLGVPTILSSFVGEDFDEGYLKSLKKSGVDLSGLKMVNGYKTPTCFIVTLPSEEQMALMDQGIMEHISDLEVPGSSINRSEIIHIGTGDPEYYRRVMDLAKEKKKRVSFDPSQELRYMYEPKVFREMLGMSDFFFCNEEEYILASEYLGAESYHDFFSYINVMVVTKGAEGSTLYTDESKVDIPAYEPKGSVDPTGAGDAYRAGFFAGLFRELSLEQCCICGAVNASDTIRHQGPQEGGMTWDEIWNTIGSD